MTNRSINIQADVEASTYITLIGSHCSGKDEVFANTSAQGSATWTWGGPPGGDPNPITVNLTSALLCYAEGGGTYWVQTPGSVTGWQWSETSTTLQGGQNGALGDVYCYSEDGNQPEPYFYRSTIFSQDYKWDWDIGQDEILGNSQYSMNYALTFTDTYIISPGATTILASAHVNADAVAYLSGATSGGRIQCGSGALASCTGAVGVSF